MPKLRLPKPPKVVPIAHEKSRVIATDEKTKRFILGIGKRRIAFDFLTRVTELPPQTGDQLARILPMKPKRK